MVSNASQRVVRISAEPRMKESTGNDISGGNSGVLRGCGRHPAAIGVFDEQLQDDSVQLHRALAVFASNDRYGRLYGWIMLANSFVTGTAWTSPQVNASHLKGTSFP